MAHLGHMRELFDGIPLGEMNTAMTINATAMWLLSLYQTVAEEQGATPDQLQGTTQNDIIKEYLSRGTYVFPTRSIVAPDHRHGCLHGQHDSEAESHQHLQLSPARGRCTPVQEIVYAMSTAIAVLDAVRDSARSRLIVSAKWSLGSRSS